MRKPFKAPDETKIWKIKKSYSPADIDGSPRATDDLWVRIDVYFTLEGNAKRDRIKDLVSVKYISQSNVYKFSEYLCLTPSVEGIIRELESFQYGLRYQNNSDEDTITILIASASLFWH